MNIDGGRLTVSARAKINLTLSILGRLESGYHLLSSLVCPISLADDVTVRIGGSERIMHAALGRDLERHVRASGNGTDQTEILRELNSPRNLAFRAAEAFFAARGDSSRGFAIEIEKRIPFGAGLGGGSADAAAVLHACNTLSETPFPMDELLSIASRIGSDVPATLRSELALMSGTGNMLLSLSPEASAHLKAVLNPTKILLLKPCASVSTPEAYRALGFERKIAASDAERFCLEEIQKDPLLGGLGLTLEASGRGDKWLTLLPQEGIRLTLDSGSEKKFDKNFLNDFQELMASRFSEIAEACSLVERVGAKHVLLCGSGSTVAGFFNSEVARDEAATELRGLAPNAWFLASAELLP